MNGCFFDLQTKFRTNINLIDVKVHRQNIICISYIFDGSFNL